VGSTQVKINNKGGEERVTETVSEGRSRKIRRFGGGGVRRTPEGEFLKF